MEFARTEFAKTDRRGTSGCDVKRYIVYLPNQKRLAHHGLLSDAIRSASLTRRKPGTDAHAPIAEMPGRKVQTKPFDRFSSPRERFRPCSRFKPTGRMPSPFGSSGLAQTQPLDQR